MIAPMDHRGGKSEQLPAQILGRKFTRGNVMVPTSSYSGCGIPTSVRVSELTAIRSNPRGANRDAEARKRRGAPIWIGASPAVMQGVKRLNPYGPQGQISCLNLVHKFQQGGT